MSTWPQMAKLYFRYSAMNAGKSTALLQVAHNYEEQGQTVRLFTAAIDTRYGIGRITSRLGPSREVEVFDAGTNFLELVSPENNPANLPRVACLLVDESQFLSAKQVQQLHVLAQTKSVPVICYGLRTDFMGEPFLGSVYLLALADDIEELKNICSCGKKATMNIRVDEFGNRLKSGEQIKIGGNEQYRQACGRCFYAE